MTHLTTALIFVLFLSSLISVGFFLPVTQQASSPPTTLKDAKDTANLLPTPSSNLPSSASIFTSSTAPAQSPSPRPKTIDRVNQIAINFTSLPAKIPAGQSFEIIWNVTGPPNAKGSDAKLIIEFASSSVTPNGSSSSNGRTSQSFGNFTVPAEFKSSHSYNTPDKTLTVTASAIVDGKNISKTKTIYLQ